MWWCTNLQTLNSHHLLHSCFFKINFNVIVPSMPRSSEMFLYFRFPSKARVLSSLFPWLTHASPFHLPFIWSSQYFLVRRKILNLFTMQFSPALYFSLSLWLKYSLRTLSQIPSTNLVLSIPCVVLAINYMHKTHAYNKIISYS